jgi:PilZ domain
METLEQSRENREFPRHHFSMLVKVGEGPNRIGRVLDFSKNGAKVATKKMIEVGEKVGLELYLRESDPFPIRLVGQCRWTRTNEEKETVAGMDLSESHPRNLGVLERFLSKYFS